jgi:hypothetical protein
MAAYNAHDLEAFLALYDPAVVLFDFPGRPLGQGHEHLRRIFQPLFAAGAVRVVVQTSLSMGPWVVTEELVHYPAGPQRYVVVYEVRGGKITSVRFLR